MTCPYSFQLAEISISAPGSFTPDPQVGFLLDKHIIAEY
jgi:hypothetical protein